MNKKRGKVSRKRKEEGDWRKPLLITVILFAVFSVALIVYLFYDDWGIDFFETSETNVLNDDLEDQFELPSGSDVGENLREDLENLESGEEYSTPSRESSGTEKSSSGSETSSEEKLCGNGVVNKSDGEDCDGTNLDGSDCIALGYDFGELSCTDACKFNVSLCEYFVCGDGILNGSEVCDPPGENVTCDAESNYAGNKTCSEDCLSYEECVATEWCGDGIINGEEWCDGNDVGSMTCENLRWGTGDLVCGNDCVPNQTSCSEVVEPTCEELGGYCNTGGCPGETLSGGNSDCVGELGFDGLCCAVSDNCAQAGGACMPECFGSNALSAGDFSCQHGEGLEGEVCCEVQDCEGLGGDCFEGGCQQGHPHLPLGNGDCYVEGGFDTYCCQSEAQSCSEVGGVCVFNCPVGEYSEGNVDCSDSGSVCCVNPEGCSRAGGSCFEVGCDSDAGLISELEGEAQCVGENGFDWYCCVSIQLAPEEKSLFRKVIEFFFRPRFWP